MSSSPAAPLMIDRAARPRTRSSLTFGGIKTIRSNLRGVLLTLSWQDSLSQLTGIRLSEDKANLLPARGSPSRGTLSPSMSRYIKHASEDVQQVSQPEGTQRKTPLWSLLQANRRRIGTTKRENTCIESYSVWTSHADASIEATLGRTGKLHALLEKLRSDQQDMERSASDLQNLKDPLACHPSLCF